MKLKRLLKKIAGNFWQRKTIFPGKIKDFKSFLVPKQFQGKIGGVEIKI